MEDFFEKLVIGLVVFTLCLICYLAVLFNTRTHRQGQCLALNGVYLKHEEICVNLNKIILDGEK